MKKNNLVLQNILSERDLAIWIDIKEREVRRFQETMTESEWDDPDLAEELVDMQKELRDLQSSQLSRPSRPLRNRSRARSTKPRR